jgi:hypothetical protein
VIEPAAQRIEQVGFRARRPLGTLDAHDLVTVAQVDRSGWKPGTSDDHGLLVIVVEREVDEPLRRRRIDAALEQVDDRARVGHRHGEADALDFLVGDLGRVDADDTPRLEADQRSARVSGVDRCIRLQHVRTEARRDRGRDSAGAREPEAPRMSERTDR